MRAFSHPETTDRLFALAGLEWKNAVKRLNILDMGAGDGSSGCSCRIDLEPRGSGVIKADMLDLPFPDGSFDAVLSQCAFTVSGNPEKAFSEAMRVLKAGGKLLLSDVFFVNPETDTPWNAFDALEDITDEWREFYFRMLWEEDVPDCFNDILKKQASAPRYFMAVYTKSG